MNMREKSIDSVKGIGILLVVLGHTYGIPDAMKLIIYSFHMPLFFIVSGYIYDPEKNGKYTFKQFLIKKTKAYLVPYYAFAGINLFLTIVWHIVVLRSPLEFKRIGIYIIGTLYCFADKTHMPNCSPIWFLMCLYIASLFFWMIMKYCEKKAGLLSFGLMIAAYCLSLMIHVRLPFNILSVCVGVFFMYVGRCLKEFKVVEHKSMGCLVILGIIAAFANDLVGMNESTYGNLVWFLMASLTLSITLMVICKERFVSQNRIFNWLGQNTMVFIAFNYFMRDFTTEVYYLIPGVKNYPIHWSISFIMTTIGCICLVPIEKRITSRISSYRLKNSERIIS